MSLKDFKDQLSQMVYGQTPAGCCVKCKQPFSDKNVHTPAGWRETGITKLCEDCFNAIFEGDDGCPND
jgi:hypothetical protein